MPYPDYEDDNEDPLSVVSSGLSSALPPESDSTANGFGIPPTRRNAYALYKSGQEAAQASATENLKRALSNQAEISPSQGIAAALLAVIPTLGGAMLQKRIGLPNLPAGAYVKGQSFNDFSKEMGPSLGAEGAKIGLGASQGYVGSIEEEAKRKTPIYEKMAALDERRAESLGNRADSVALGGLSAQEALARQAQGHKYALSEIEARKNAQIAVRNSGNQQLSPLVQSWLAKKEQGIKPTLEESQAAAAAGMDVYAAGNAATGRNAYAERTHAELTGDKALPLPSRVTESLGAADAVEFQQQRIRKLYDAAMQEVGPGFAQAFARKGLAALPANMTNEFMGTLNALAMELNKAVDPTPSDAGRMAQLQKLEASINNGNFLEALDFDAQKTKAIALAKVQPFAGGDNPNEQAKSLHNEYAKKWGFPEIEVSPSMQKQPDAPGSPENPKSFNKEDPAYQAILARKRKEKGL